MSDFTVVDPKGWEYDLHSVYSAYIGYFQQTNIPWYDRTWGHLFSSFEAFLSFSWPVITITDVWTGKPHIVTRLTSIGAFIKMIKTRFGETLLQAPNILQVTPFESGTRHLRHLSDYSAYKKLHATLPAVFLSAFKTRVRAGEPKAIRELWNKRDKTFVAIDFEWNERNASTCLEWGYAAVRCGRLSDHGHWPPSPDSNYRKGHYIVAEYVDKVFNKHSPTHPWQAIFQYAFGDSQVVPKAKLPQIIEAVISSFASPDSETTANTLVLVAHGISGDLARLEEMKIKIPHNVLIIDTATYERALHASGFRGIMQHPMTNRSRISGSTLSLENVLRSFATNPPQPESASGNQPNPTLPGVILPNVMMGNAGNDTFLCLFALQMLLDPVGTHIPSVTKASAAVSQGKRLLGGGVIPFSVTSPGPIMNSLSMPIISSGYLTTKPPYDLSSEFGQMQIGMERSKSKSPVRPRVSSGNANGSLGGLRQTVWRG